ncbi:MerR family transcriptional regulator [Streptomyces sp. SBST2-5]|uniref:MerR family transcriptional regulator n=1 Tax=Streptomyces composti TaxID=2720025 RepID=A0ABX1AAI4_9ACTN|nr:MerR family transcriptional regulator [Streptomyces composti]NJP50483.1 MerR family transcriptional regulator [Streptomyces composti]
MRIGELAARTGVSTRTLRYYEEKGLLRPGRTAAGYRVYGEEHVETVRRIRILLAAGLGTDVIGEILPCMVDEGEYLAPGCDDLVALLEAERRRIDDRIAELRDVRSALTGIIRAGKRLSAA